MWLILSACSRLAQVLDSEKTSRPYHNRLTWWRAAAAAERSKENEEAGRQISQERVQPRAVVKVMDVPVRSAVEETIEGLEERISECVTEQIGVHSLGQSRQTSIYVKMQIEVPVPRVMEENGEEGRVVPEEKTQQRVIVMDRELQIQKQTGGGIDETFQDDKIKEAGQSHECGGERSRIQGRSLEPWRRWR